MAEKMIPVCPMLSSGLGYDVVCARDKCAWYVKSSKLCAVYVIAHNNLLDIQSKLVQPKK